MEAEEELWGWFESTDWNLLGEPRGYDINAMNECVTNYITFCVESIMPTRTVRCFLNNKPWITSDLKRLLNKSLTLTQIKKKAFREEDRELLRDVQIFKDHNVLSQLEHIIGIKGTAIGCFRSYLFVRFQFVHTMKNLTHTQD